MTRKPIKSVDQVTIDEFCQYLEQLIPKANQLAVDAGKPEKDDRIHDSLEDAILYSYQCGLFKNEVKAATKKINKSISSGSKTLNKTGNIPDAVRNFSDAIAIAMGTINAPEVRYATFNSLIYTLLYNDSNIVRSFSRALKLIFKLYEIASKEEYEKRKYWSRTTQQRIATHSQCDYPCILN